MGAKFFFNTHMSTKCGLKETLGFFCRKVEKCWQNGGDGEGPKLTMIVTKLYIILYMGTKTVNVYLQLHTKK